MGQIAFAISSVPEIPVVQNFDVKQHSMKKAQDKSLGSLQLVMMRSAFECCSGYFGLCFTPGLTVHLPGITPGIILHPALILAGLCLVKCRLHKQLQRKQLRLHFPIF